MTNIPDGLVHEGLNLGQPKDYGNDGGERFKGDDIISVIFKNLDFMLGPFEKFMHKMVTFSDPITVTITLFCILAPFALLYLILARIGFVLMTQMDIKGKNILYVIAHPDDAVL